MTKTKQILLALSLALNSKNLFAATATAVAAGATAAHLGADPWPWIVGATGAAIAFLVRAPTTRRVALAHGGVSILCGGIGAPWVGSLLSHYVHPVWANDLVWAAVLSIGWPFFVPLLMGWIERVAATAPTRHNGG